MPESAAVRAILNVHLTNGGSLTRPKGCMVYGLPPEG